MIRDVQTIYSDAQAVTDVGTTDSTNTIDQLAAGDTYVPQFLRVRVNTAFTSGGSGTLAVNLVTDDASNFGSATTIPLVAATAVASLIANKVLFQGRLPIGIKRYRKLQYVVGTAAMTAGKIDAEEVIDIPTNRM